MPERLSEEAIQQIKVRLSEASPDGIADMGSKAARDVIEDDAPALVAEVEKLQADLQTALGALADIANMTKGEIARGTAQRKAARIYNFIRDLKPDDPDRLGMPM